MSRIALKGRVVTDYEVFDEGALVIEDGAVLGVSPDDSAIAEAGTGVEVRSFGEALILPGFVDLQVNGAFGIDLATEPESLDRLSKDLLSTGVTSFLPTVITSSEDLYERALPILAEAVGESQSGAEALGVHLEGPFIDPEKKAAHPEQDVRAPDASFLDWLMDLAPVRLLTLAPELDGARGLMESARNRGVAVSAGHSGADFQSAYDAFDHHAASVTHLFNAMSPLHHRAPGLPGAAFAHPRVVCGLIADGLHVHPEVVALAFRMLGPDRVSLVTDSIAAAGVGPGEYALSRQRIYVQRNKAPRLADGTIAGSVLTMREAFRNVLAFTGCTIPEAARMVAATPARLIGEGRRKGRLTPGHDADVTVLAPDLSVASVWKAGREVYTRRRAAKR